MYKRSTNKRSFVEIGGDSRRQDVERMKIVHVSRLDILILSFGLSRH